MIKISFFKNYLNELVSRSMIEAVQISDFRRIQSCRIHDVMREIIQLKCGEELFVAVVNEKGTTPSEKVRHLAIHLHGKSFPESINKSCLRSLLVSTPADPSTYLQHAFFSGYRFLRVLDLDRAPISKFPPGLVELVHLRYLSLEFTKIKELPESIGKLSSLERLVLKGTPVSNLRTGILKLKNLVELQNYRYHLRSSTFFADTYGMTVPKGIGSLTNLQKLGSVEVQQGVQTVKELGKLTQLKSLAVLKLTREDGNELCSSLEKMRHLTSLYLVSISNEEQFKLETLSNPPTYLQRLYLKVCLTTLPEWIVSLCHLSKLVLQNLNLNTDPLEALQNLPNLVVLDLRLAYNGQELYCSSSGYSKLKKLCLHQMENLESVCLAKGAMPMLSGLEISCFQLKEVPSGIEHLKNLQELLLWQMPETFLKGIEPSQGIHFWKVQHIPNLKHVYPSRGRLITEIVRSKPGHHLLEANLSLPS